MSFANARFTNCFRVFQLPFCPGRPKSDSWERMASRSGPESLVMNKNVTIASTAAAMYRLLRRFGLLDGRYMMGDVSLRCHVGWAQGAEKNVREFEGLRGLLLCRVRCWRTSGKG